MAIRSAIYSHVGRRRSRQEDAAAATRRTFVVADGMGGHAGGDIASDIVARAFADDRIDFQRATCEAILAIQRYISDTDLTYMSMGSTVVALRLSPDATAAEVFHVGDSRCYRLRGDQLTCVTRDHTIARNMLDADVDPDRIPDGAHHTLTQAISCAAVELVGETTTIDIADGDVLLLCSDGLTDELDDATIAATLNKHRTDPAAAAAALVDAAVDAGGRDNITTIVIAAGA